MAEVVSNVARFRRERGLSANELALAAGVSRQTIYAIEAGTYIPNTSVSLQLARALDSTVEELFTLRQASPPQRSEHPALLPDAQNPARGQGVQLCRVDDKLIACSPSPVPWVFPPADAVVIDKRRHARKALVHLFQPDSDFENRVLVAGCDPGISILSRHVRNAGVEMVLAQRNSSQALSLLEQGCVHIAGTHLRDEATGDSNIDEVRRRFAQNSVAVISFAVWEEGLVTAPGNPKGIKGVADLSRPQISIVNREEGSGSRALLDAQLQNLGISAEKVRGFERLADGHLAASWQVHSGAVDCCVSTRAAAHLFGLHFVPLVSERYDLVIRRKHLDLPRIQTLLEVLSRSAFRRELQGFGGYDSTVAGRRVL